MTPAEFSLAAALPAALFAGPLLVAAVLDALTYRIPNLVTLTLALAFIPAALMAPQPVAWGSHLAAGGLTFAAVFLAFLRGWIGGGDAKLLAAVALWVGLAGLPVTALLVGMFGGALGVGLLAARRVFPLVVMAQRLRALRPGAPVPYGVAVAAGAIAAMPNLPLFAA